MEDRYHRQNIEIILDREDEVYKEVEALAVAEGVPVEDLINSLASRWIGRHIKENLRFHKVMEVKRNGSCD